MYWITDDYGTKQFAWTLKGAIAWLPYCGTNVVITNWFTGNVVCGRKILELI